MANDAPSGLGSNAQMDTLDTLIAARLTAPSSPASGEAPVWNGSAWVRSSATRLIASSVRPVRTATTVGGLPGTAEDGAMAMLRTGSSPYDFMPLVYDGTYAKWVGPTMTVATNGTQVTTTNTTATWIGSITVHSVGTPIVPYRVFSAAGLTMQARIVVALSVAGGATGTADLITQAADANGGYDAAITQGSPLAVTTTSASAVIKDSGWNALSGITTRDFIIFEQAAKTSSGANAVSVSQFTIYARWVS